MAAQRLPALNILLVGKTGVGKSATGNSLLGSKVFASKVGISVTNACKQATATRDGVQITVIDTPGICDTRGLDAAKVIDDYITTKNCELHAICLVLSSYARPTAEENQAVAELSKRLGSAMSQYLFIVITSAENLDLHGVKPKDFLKGFVTTETNILHTCFQKDRVFGIDNLNDEKKKQQIRELLKTVNTMVSENKGAMYTLRILEQNKKRLEEEVRSLKEERDKKDREKAEQRKREIESEKNKAREEERQKLQKEREVNVVKGDVERWSNEGRTIARRQSDKGYEKWIEGFIDYDAIKAVVAVSTGGVVAGLTAEAIIAVPIIAVAAPVVAGVTAGLTAGAYLLKKLFF